jgi:protein-disulfide isomerase
MDERSVSREDVVVFKRSYFYALMVVLAFAAGVLVGYVAWGRESATSRRGQAVGPVAEAPYETPEPKYTRYEIPTDGFPSLGPQDAPIVIVEFSDYQCPYCQRWHQQTFKPLLAAYPGKIRLVYRNLPLTSIHPEAYSAAVAALCANEQNAYWPYHDRLFEGQYGLGPEVYTQYAADLGLDMTAFQECLASKRYDQFVQEDMKFAMNLGVRSTPTFFINGLAVVGAQPLDVFKQIIDKELAGEIPK